MAPITSWATHLHLRNISQIGLECAKDSLMALDQRCTTRRRFDTSRKTGDVKIPNVSQACPRQIFLHPTIE